MLIGWIIFNSHMLSGAFLFVCIFSLTAGVWLQRKTNYKKVMSMATVPIIIVLLNFFWPLYDQYLYLIDRNQASPVLNTVSQPTSNSVQIISFIQKWYAVIGVGIIGILFLVKSRLYKMFFTLLFLVVGYILISSLTPFPIKFNWRFIPLLMIAVSAGWIALLSSLKNRMRYAVIACVVIIGFLNVNTKINIFRDWSPYTFQQPYYDDNQSSMNILYGLQSDAILFTNPKESHVASGLTGINVVGVRPHHANFLQSEDQAKGYNDLVSAFETPDYIKTVIVQYNVSYIMLRNHPDDFEKALVAYSNNNFKVAKKNQEYTLYLADASSSQ